MVFQLSTWGMGESTDAATPPKTSSAPPPVRPPHDQVSGAHASGTYTAGSLRILSRKGRRRFRMEHPYMPGGGGGAVEDEEEEDDYEEDAGEVSLFPLSNQVGGHTRLLLLNDGTICKPLNARELNFYQHIPDEIQKFVPKFKVLGCIKQLVFPYVKGEWSLDLSGGPVIGFYRPATSLPTLPPKPSRLR